MAAQDSRAERDARGGGVGGGRGAAEAQKSMLELTLPKELGSLRNLENSNT